MGTRGVCGFYRDGVSKINYNHFDSYPEELGKNLLEEVRNVDISKLNKVFNNIVMVNEKKKPTKEQIDELKEFANINVSSGKVDEWYVLLRENQGTFKNYLNGSLSYMIDGQDFIKDSLFCEWGYIINLNTNKFEVWRGFQKKQNNNRYSILQPDGDYYSCDLVAEFELGKLPNIKDFLDIWKTKGD